MSAGEAADVFTRLSIGDGLVTQIPALIVALAAGLVVSKGGTRGSADRAVLDQLGHYPKALWVASGILLALGLLPGLPALPFMALAGFCAFVAQRSAATFDVAAVASAAALEAKKSPDRLLPARPEPAPIIELAIGKQLAARILDPRNDLARRIARVRKRLASQFGFVAPEIRIREEFRLTDRQYRIFIQGSIAAQFEMRLGEVLVVIGDGKRPDLPGEETLEPSFGLKALWFPEGFATELKRQGFEPVNTESILLTHLTETIKANLGSVFTYRDLRGVLDSLEGEYRRLLDDISPSIISAPAILGVMKALLSERVSIRNMPAILEAIAEVAPQSRKVDQIVEGVRTRLAAQICFDCSDDGLLRIIRMGRWDSVFSSSIRRDQKGDIIEFGLEPRQVEDFVTEINPLLRAQSTSGAPFVVVASADARPFVRLLVERLNPAVPVLSQLEAARYRSVETIGTMS